MRKEHLIEIICALHIILFIYAAGSKLIDIDEFHTNLGQSPLITAFADWIAWIVPVAELVIAIMLAITSTRLLALYASYTLMLMFTAYIVAIMNFSFYVPCSCGGVLASLGWGEHLVFNIIFVMLSLTGIILLSENGTRNVQETDFAK